jgi:hypothetical protein
MPVHWNETDTLRGVGYPVSRGGALAISFRSISDSHISPGFTSDRPLRDTYPHYRVQVGAAGSELAGPDYFARVIDTERLCIRSGAQRWEIHLSTLIGGTIRTARHAS